MKRLVVLISGQGRNLASLLQHCAAGNIQAQVVAVVSNRPDAPGLARAEQAGIATAIVDHREFASRADFDAALMQSIDAFAPDALILAGFMRILTPAFVRHYAGRALNIHPSLLPLYPGINTHAAALAAGDTEHGASVHFLTEQLDGGPIILQGRLKIAAEDTTLTLAERVMNEVELKIYPQAVAWLASAGLKLESGAVHLHGQPLRSPKTLADLDEVFL